MSDYVLKVDGFCPVCEQAATFASKDEWLRDHFLCQSCGSQPRERALFSVLTQLRPDWRALAIHESSPGTAASRRLADQARGYLPSQYDPSIPWGSIHPNGRWRSEDLERQTFADESFDLVITQDVMEHVFAPDLAVREIARTLKPGGMHICTVPIVNKEKPSVRRARRRPDGSVEHLAAVLSRRSNEPGWSAGHHRLGLRHRRLLGRRQRPDHHHLDHRGPGARH